MSTKYFSYIKLPSLNGSYKDWLLFKETLASIRDKNPYLPKAQKFNYLRMSLRGEPFNLIASLEISNLKYEITWKTLSEKYENIE